MKTGMKDFLRLVWDYAAHSVSANSQQRREPSMQMELFAGNSSNSILVIYFSEVDAKSFSDAIHSTHPSFIIDMRTNPRFDLEGYSRTLAFKEFDTVGTVYLDYVELLGREDRTKGDLISAAEKFIDRSKKGPFVFLFGRKDQDGIYEEELLEHLPIDRKDWKLSVMPH